MHVDPGLRVHLSKAGERQARRAKGGIIQRHLQMDGHLIEVAVGEAHIDITPDEYAEALQRYYDRR